MDSLELLTLAVVVAVVVAIQMEALVVQEL
jgi:hypothetical protein